jgi:cell division protein FtsW
VSITPEALRGRLQIAPETGTPRWRAMTQRANTTWRVAGAARPPLYWAICAVVGVLNLVGLVMILSASSVSSISDYGSAWFFFERQSMWTFIGIGAFIVASRVDYRRWQRWARPILILSLVLLVLVLVPGLGTNVDGSTRWLGRGSFRFQPTDIAKLGLLIFTADLVVRRRDVVDRWKMVLAPALIVFGAGAFLMMLQPDMDSTVMLALIVGTVLFIGGVRFRVFSGLSLAGLGVAAVLAVAAPYRRARVFAYLNPWKDASNRGYQIAQSLIAIGSGGWFGVGLGAGRAKWLFLPNAHTDFIFAIIGEELGLIGCFSVVALFVGLAAFGTMTARRAPDQFGQLVAAGVTLWIVAQAVINIGSVIGLLPVSGIPLPFVSFGGASLIITMASAGILANIARHTAQR